MTEPPRSFEPTSSFPTSSFPTRSFPTGSFPTKSFEPPRCLSVQLPSPNSLSEKDIKLTPPLFKSFDIEKKYSNDSNSIALESIINVSDNQNIKSSNKFIIDEFITQILNLPKKTLLNESIEPYNVSTLNEVLKYKIEQEKTKQESFKANYCDATYKILKMVDSMNLNHDLIPIIFKSDEDSLNLLKSKLHQVEKFHEKNIEKDSDDIKRKYSDTHLPSFNQTAESIRSNIHSPINSPHDRGHRKSSSASSRGSKHSPSQQNSQPTSKYSPSQQNSQPISKCLQTSPPHIQSQIPPNGYQVYYGPVENSNQPIPNGLGSPYSQAHSDVLYQKPPGYAVPRYQYYGDAKISFPFNPTVIPIQSQPPVPSHQFQSTESESTKSNIFRSAEIHEDSQISKKQKTSKGTSINFMITTPKNPPARKYNNPHRDK